MSAYRPLSRRALLGSLGGMALLSGAPRAAAQDQRPFRIYMALFRGFEDAAQGFQDYLIERGLPVSFIMRNIEQDLTRVPEMVAEIRRLKPDLVLTWGTGLTVALVGPHDAVDPAKHITEFPVVFMIVSQPLQAKVVADLAHPGRNVTGVNYLIPEDVQLNFARRYLPFRRLGIVYNPAEQNAHITVAELKKLAASMTFDLVEAPLPLDAAGRPNAADIPAAIAKLKSAGVEMIYQGPDSFLNELRRDFTEAAVAQGLPVFAAGEGPVRTGSALMGVVNRYHTVGQLAALRAEQILVGKQKPGDIAVELPERFSVIVNIRVAKALELYPPMPLLKFAEIVR